jgi:hypothetical protein
LSYAGFEGESVLLQSLYKRGLAQPELGEDLRGGDGLLMFWSHKPIASWQDENWLKSDAARARVGLPADGVERVCRGRIGLCCWDACVLADLKPVAESKRTQIWVGVDASVKRDSTALVATSFDRKRRIVRLIAHRVFVPTPGDPIDFEATIEATLLEWRKRFMLRKVWFDPYQMQSTAQRLAKAGARIEEYPQTVPNLTSATSNLFDLISARQLVLYPDAGMRLAISRAIIVESSRGWRLDKLKQSHKIDVVAALSLSALATIRSEGESSYPRGDNSWISGPVDTSDEAKRAEREFQDARFAAHLYREAGPYLLRRW